MSIVVDGITIQKCDGVDVDNVNMTIVKADNTNVYTESCFSGIWSGSTRVPPVAEKCCTNGNTPICLHRDTYYGLECSGTNHRISKFNGTHGVWVTSGPNGLGSGQSYLPTSADGFQDSVLSNAYEIEWRSSATSPHTSGYSGDINFNMTDGFSGEQYAWSIFMGHTIVVPYVEFRDYFQTSGGQLRMRQYNFYRLATCTFNDQYGQWITLT